MNRAIHCGRTKLAWATLALAILFSADGARANSDDENGGPSRAQLFSLFVRSPAEADLGILGSALPFSFRFPLHVREDGIFGIDVSHHNEDLCNCQFDWDVIANQRISFAYLKATQGALFRDKKFINNWNTLAKHPRIHRGAYHFLSAKQDPIDQAKNFLSIIGPMQAKDMPPCLDMEWDMVTIEGQTRDAWSDLSSDEIVDRALKWLNAVKVATGRIPVIYTANSWWKGRIKEDKTALFARYPIWIADYSEKGLGQEKPSVPSGREWAMWQFTEKGALEQGIPGHVDANIFKGTLAEFHQKFGIVLASTAPETPNTTTSVPNNTGAPGDSTVPNTQPGRDASFGTPNSGTGPAGGNSATGGAEAPKTNATTSPSANTTRSAPRRPTNDDDFGFKLRGGPEIRVE